MNGANVNKCGIANLLWLDKNNGFRVFRQYAERALNYSRRTTVGGILSSEEILNLEISSKYPFKGLAYLSHLDNNVMGSVHLETEDISHNFVHVCQEK